MKRCIKCKEEMDNLFKSNKVKYIVCFDCEVEIRLGYSTRENIHSQPMFKPNWDKRPIRV